jgi:hypothetical protein
MDDQGSTSPNNDPQRARRTNVNAPIAARYDALLTEREVWHEISPDHSSIVFAGETATASCIGMITLTELELEREGEEPVQIILVQVGYELPDLAVAPDRWDDTAALCGMIGPNIGMGEFQFYPTEGVVRFKVDNPITLSGAPIADETLMLPIRAPLDILDDWMPSFELVALKGYSPYHALALAIAEDSEDDEDRAEEVLLLTAAKARYEASGDKAKAAEVEKLMRKLRALH